MENLGLGRKLWLLFVIQSVLYILGIYIFTQGFLLSRLVVPKTSRCNDSIGASTMFPARVVNNKSIDSCWRNARFKKAILIIIDALRYDFMLYNESLEERNSLSFQNKLGIIHEVLKQKPDHGQIFQFVADPPTTTMQRIKGLTTGSLPTFIDAGSNFASSEIHEDNIVAQLKSHGKKIVFMGDDTWMGLFPNLFERSYPYPSFNVKDLHTVDNGVISHLVPEIQRPDWDVIIAHFLGVDHCGHRYGPYHPAMADKLTQMDLLLRAVIDVLDNDTILMVFGDHGMTRTGDHGGDSDDEVQAGLFVYSSTKLFSASQFEDNHVVSQTDIVPTLSLLLGIPIPFSNLGIIIQSLFTNSGSPNIPDSTSILHALQLNTQQVHRYIMEYTALSNDISLDTFNTTASPLFHPFHNFYNRDVTKIDILKVEKKYFTYLKQIREVCRSVWAKFDESLIQTGLFMTTVSLGVNLVSILLPIELFIGGRECHQFYKSGFLTAVIVLFPVLYFYGHLLVFFVFLACLTVPFFLTFRKRIFDYMKQNFAYINLKGIIIVPVVFVQFVGYYSNSYVINEDKVLLFLIQTIMVLIAGVIFTNFLSTTKNLQLENCKVNKTQKRKEQKKQRFLWPIIREIRGELAYLFILMALFRLGSLFWSCREEQSTCDPTEFVSRFEPNGYKFCLKSIFLLLVPASLIFRLRVGGNLDGYSCPVVAVKYALPFGTVFACLHWLLQNAPAKMVEQNPVVGFIQQILAPCILYFSCLGSLCCLFYQPNLTFVTKPHDLEGEPAVLTNRESLRHSVVETFKQLRSELNKGDANQNIRYVCGLGTAYSSALLILLACFALPVALVLGDGLGSSVTLMVAQMCLFLEIDKIMTSPETDDVQVHLDSLLFSVITWSVMSSYNFYSSGHQATIPSIRFEAAFVGLPGDMDSLYLPGVLILLNTFASDVIFSIALPLIIFWRKQTSSSQTSGEENRNRTGEFVYHDYPTKLRCDMFRVHGMYQVCKGFKLLGTMSAAAVHRRHLMVWKIFAPRFIFEGISFIISSLILMLVFAFVLRVDNALNAWCLTLQCRREKTVLS